MEWLDRMTAVMDTISEAAVDGMGVTQIAKSTLISKGTLHRMLKNMVEHKLVTQDPTSKKYRLGPKSMRWGSRFLIGQDPSGLLFEHCDWLADQTQMYTYLCRLDAGEVFCIYTRQPSKDRNHYFVRLGQRMPLYCSASAKAILAFQPPSVMTGLICQETVRQFTPYTKTQFHELLAELQEISQRHVAFCEEELEVGVSAISAPIFQSERKTSLSISIVGATRLINMNRQSLIEDLLTTSKKASEQLSNAYLLSSTASVGS